MIQPLANRVLVKPDAAPTVTESGLFIPDNARGSKDFEMAGTVIRKGTGPASAQRVRAAMIGRFRRVVEKAQDEVPSSGVCCHLLRQIDQMDLENVDCSDVQEGDHVAFPYTAGTVIEVDGERYLLMNEDQIVAVLARDEVAV